MHCAHCEYELIHFGFAWFMYAHFNRLNLMYLSNVSIIGNNIYGNWNKIIECSHNIRPSQWMLLDVVRMQCGISASARSFTVFNVLNKSEAQAHRELLLLLLLLLLARITLCKFSTVLRFIKCLSQSRVFHLIHLIGSYYI